jgi:hypothetical protein
MDTVERLQLNDPHFYCDVCLWAVPTGHSGLQELVNDGAMALFPSSILHGKGFFFKTDRDNRRYVQALIDDYQYHFDRQQSLPDNERIMCRVVLLHDMIMAHRELLEHLEHVHQ